MPTAVVIPENLSELQFDLGEIEADKIRVITASQVEAEAGLSNVVLMTPLRVAEAIAELGGGGGSSAWEDITGTPDTLVGYGITDAPPSDATYIVQTPHASLSGEQALSALATGLLKNTTATGVLSIGVAGTDYLAPGAIGVTVQGYSSVLAGWAGVTPGAGVAAALAIDINESGAVVLNDGELGTPVSGALTNCIGLPLATGVTGTLPDARFPATLPAASGVNLTALNGANIASGNIAVARLSTALTTPGPIGSGTPGTGAFTSLGATGDAIIAGTVYCGSSSGFLWYTGGLRSQIMSPASGIHTLKDNGTGTYDRLQFGGTTSSFPSLKRSTTSLKVRLADDSDDADLTGRVITPKSYTVATVPAAASYGGGVIYVSNEAGGAVVAQSNGTNWQRLTDLATIS